MEKIRVQASGQDVLPDQWQVFSLLSRSRVGWVFCVLVGFDAENLLA